MNFTEKSKRIQSLKQWIAGLDSNHARLRYIIFVCFAENTGTADYREFNSGNKEKSDGGIADSFNQQIDMLLDNPMVAKIKVTANNGKRKFGEMEITVQEAYMGIKPNMPIVQKNSEVQEPSKPNIPPDFMQHAPRSFDPQMAELFGMAFLGEEGLGSTGEQLGVTGMLLAGQKHTMKQQFEQEKKAAQLAELQKQNGILEQKIISLESENKRQATLIDKYEDKIFDLEEELKEYARINPKRNMVSGLAGELASAALAGFIKKTPALAGIATALGMVDTEEEIPVQQQPPAYEQTHQQQPPIYTPQVEVVETSNEEEVE